MTWRDAVERDYPEGTVYLIAGRPVPRAIFWKVLRMQPDKHPVVEVSGDLTPREFAVRLPI